MKLPKAQQLLQLLSPAEMRKFQKHLNAQVQNNKSAVFRLFMCLKQYHPGFKKVNLTKEVVFRKTFPKEVFQEKKLRKAYSELSHWLEEFFVLKEIRNDQFMRNKILATAFRKRGSMDLFEKKIEGLIQELESEEVRDIYFYQEMLLLNHELYFQPKSLKKRTNEMTLSIVLDNLDKYFALKKLSYSCELFMREKTLAEHYEKEDIPFLKETILYAEKIDGTDKLVFDIYLKIIQLQTQGHSENVFQNLVNDFQKYIQLFSETEQQNLLQILLNHANFIAKTGDATYFRKQFDLYKIGLTHNLMVQEGKMADALFTNIAILGAIVQEPEWTKKFTEDYQICLDEKTRHLAVVLSQAYLFFHQKDYLNAEKKLEQIQSHALDYFYRGSSLMIRCFFELFLQDDNYFDVLERKLASFEKYIRRNDTLSDNWKRGYLNFVKFTRKLFLLETNATINSTHKDELKNDIHVEKVVIAKRWLLEKIKEL